MKIPYVNLGNQYQKEKKEYLYFMTKKPILEELLAGIFLGQRQ